MENKMKTENKEDKQNKYSEKKNADSKIGSVNTEIQDNKTDTTKVESDRNIDLKTGSHDTAIPSTGDDSKVPEINRTKDLKSDSYHAGTPVKNSGAKIPDKDRNISLKTDSQSNTDASVKISGSNIPEMGKNSDFKISSDRRDLTDKIADTKMGFNTNLNSAVAADKITESKATVDDTTEELKATSPVTIKDRIGNEATPETAKSNYFFFNFLWAEKRSAHRSIFKLSSCAQV